jgi:hypothetical protein
VWWFTSVISALGKWKQEDLEFKASLSYIGNLRPAWTTEQYPVSKKIKPKQNENDFACVVPEIWRSESGQGRALSASWQPGV